MKLIQQRGGSWRYFLNQNEADILRSLVKKFPVAEVGRATISKTAQDSHAVEREKLLHEALTEHRKELQQLAGNLLAGKFENCETGQSLTLTSEAREILLQILNDLRVGCWRALGEPEHLESPVSKVSNRDLAYRNLMDLAGYFEHHLLATEPDAEQ